MQLAEAEMQRTPVVELRVVGQEDAQRGLFREHPSASGVLHEKAAHCFSARDLLHKPYGRRRPCPGPSRQPRLRRTQGMEERRPHQARRLGSRR